MSVEFYFIPEFPMSAIYQAPNKQISALKRLTFA